MAAQPQLYRVRISQDLYVIARSHETAQETALSYWIEDNQLPQVATATAVGAEDIPPNHMKIGPWVAEDSFDDDDDGEAPSIAQFLEAQASKEKVQ